MKILVALLSVAVTTGVWAATASAATGASPLVATDVEGLIEQLGPAESRPSARRLLLALGRQAVPGMLGHLARLDPTDQATLETRLELIALLEAAGDPRSTPALVGVATGDPNPRIRWQALRALGKLPRGPSEPGARALALLREDLTATDEPVRWNAAVALSWFAAPDGLPVLHVGVTDRDPWRRWEAVTALGRVHDATTPRVLGQLLLSPSRSDREETVLALGQVGGGEAFLLLLSALKDGAPEVRWRACLALGRLGMPEAILPLHDLKARETDGRVLKHVDQAILRLEALL